MLFNGRVTQPRVNLVLAILVADRFTESDADRVANCRRYGLNQTSDPDPGDANARANANTGANSQSDVDA